MISIGHRNRQISIQTVPYTLDTDGGVIGASSPLTTLATVWAHGEPFGGPRTRAGREAFAAQQLIAEVDYLFEINYRTDVTPKMQVLYGARTFRIEVVLPNETMRKSMTLLCKEIV